MQNTFRSKTRHAIHRENIEYCIIDYLVERRKNANAICTDATKASKMKKNTQTQHRPLRK